MVACCTSRPASLVCGGLACHSKVLFKDYSKWLQGPGVLPDHLRVSHSKMVAGWAVAGQAPAAPQMGALSAFNDVWSRRQQRPSGVNPGGPPQHAPNTPTSMYPRIGGGGGGLLDAGAGAEDSFLSMSMTQSVTSTFNTAMMTGITTSPYDPMAGAAAAAAGGYGPQGFGAMPGVHGNGPVSVAQGRMHGVNAGGGMSHGVMNGMGADPGKGRDPVSTGWEGVSLAEALASRPKKEVQPCAKRKT